MKYFMAFLRKLYKLYYQYKTKKYIASLINKGLRIGKDVKIVADFFFDPSHCYLIEIGDNCIICPNVRLIAHDASTFGFLGYTKLGKIKIGANCFIGDSVIILPKVKIGENCIIGAGSVVTQNIPPFSVAAGNPARIISTLDAYIKKIEIIRRRKSIFDDSYWISSLNTEKTDELRDSIGSSIGFIR